MDKLKSLLIFMRSAQHRSFSEAARQLGMSPSAASRAVLRLEEDLGIRLLQRTTRSLTLTDDGSRFYDRCQQILDELEEAELEIKQSQTIPTGTLRLDLSTALGKMHIAPALPRFAAQYPELTLNVSFSDRFVDLIDEGIDATIRVGMGGDSRLIMRSLATMRLVTCASPKYLTSNGLPTTPSGLNNHHCINFIYPQTRREFDWKFEQNEKPLSFSVKSHLQFDDAEVVLDAAIQGAGIIQLPKYIAAGAMACGELQPILQDYTAQTGLPIALVYPQKRHLSAKVRCFAEFMVELITALKQAGVVD
ncbi:LysR substrate-binding domain-containing protein [Leptolyngbya sp. FACHB-261]|uniref:LysR family transcriptional regulator n=1 Tax=Leptolyngbya sp. FACHB-261 TaxID=2692806 RepID=UPI001683B4FE|nr:LysR substrate-binding domain-containing protein [Leptolyngbya sp. FACHB-261]MBD2102541.1 LysR family transcriptional regulator [Leptolyngbya sp. FACHB-261]